MIAQEIVFTRDFLKASRICDYAQLKKIPCGNKKQARARVIYEFSGLEHMNKTSINIADAAEPGLFRILAAIFYDSVLVAALMMAAFTLIYLPLAIGFGMEDLQQYPIYKAAMSLWMLSVGIGFHLWFWTHGGQTLGMRAWRLMLFSNNGSSPTFRQAVVRYAVAIISLLVLGLGFVWILIDPQKRSWHDIASGTRLVLVDPNKT